MTPQRALLHFSACLALVVAAACELERPVAPNKRLVRGLEGPDKECMMTSLGSGLFLTVSSDTQYLWTVPVITNWGGGGYDGVWGDDGSSTGEWWHFEGTWYCEGGGGGGTYFPNINPDTLCDPIADPRSAECRLTPSQKTAIKAALTSFVRSPSEYTDSATQVLCQSMLGWSQMTIDSGWTVQTANDSAPPDSAIGHYAAFDANSGFIHLEPWMVSDAMDGDPKAQWELAASIMHEVIHQLAPGGPFTHRPQTNSAVWLPGSYYYRGKTLWYDPTTEYPFNLLNHPIGGTPPSNQTCMLAYP